LPTVTPSYAAIASVTSRENQLVAWLGSLATTYAQLIRVSP
jgi:hypothetical protein